MTSDPGTSLRSRRSILTRAAAAGAAAVAVSVTRPLPAAATDHVAILQGETSSGSLTTVIDGGNANPSVKGVSGSGIGIWGASTSNFGAHGSSTSNAGVVGISQTSAGVFGMGGLVGTGAPAETGVAGWAAVSGDSIGVWGSTLDGTGVSGSSTSGTGVVGTSTNSTGVFGTSAGAGGFGVYGQATGISGIGVTGYAEQNSGIGGYFYTVSPLIGIALRATGKVSFDQSAGVATIKRHTKSVVVTPGCKLSSHSAVTATLMSSAGGTIVVQRVLVSSASGRFTIYLTGTATVAARVAWHVFN